MSSTWIFDPWYGYYEVRFGGTAKVLQNYFAIAFIVIWLCMFNYVRRLTFIVLFILLMYTQHKFIIHSYTKFGLGTWHMKGYYFSHKSDGVYENLYWLWLNLKLRKQNVIIEQNPCYYLYLLAQVNQIKGTFSDWVKQRHPLKVCVHLHFWILLSTLRFWY